VLLFYFRDVPDTEKSSTGAAAQEPAMVLLFSHGAEDGRAFLDVLQGGCSRGTSSTPEKPVPEEVAGQSTKLVEKQEDQVDSSVHADPEEDGTQPRQAVDMLDGGALVKSEVKAQQDGDITSVTTRCSASDDGTLIACSSNAGIHDDGDIAVVTKHTCSLTTSSSDTQDQEDVAPVVSSSGSQERLRPSSPPSDSELADNGRMVAEGFQREHVQAPLPAMSADKISLFPEVSRVEEAVLVNKETSELVT